LEDLVSTGMSSLNAVQILRNAGYQVMGMVAIFSYCFEIAKENFKHYQCPLFTLSDYPSLIETAVNKGYISNKDLSSLNSWRKDPANWNIYV